MHGGKKKKKNVVSSDVMKCDATLKTKPSYARAKKFKTPEKSISQQRVVRYKGGKNKRKKDEKICNLFRHFTILLYNEVVKAV